jgi:hypothetical protein
MGPRIGGRGDHPGQIGRQPQFAQHMGCGLAEADEAEPPAPAPKAKKAVKTEAAEAIEEPVVRKEEKKANAVPAKKSNLAEMVDDWDENE